MELTVPASTPLSFPRWLRHRAPSGIFPTATGYADLVGDVAYEIVREVRDFGLRREIAELRRANEILKTASAF